MKIKQAFILYSLPKSRTTQQLNGGRKIDKSWSNVCHFLNSCTTVRSDQPTSVTLVAYRAYKDDSNPEIADKIIHGTQQFFGAGETNPPNSVYPSGFPDRQEWNFEAHDFQKVIDYLIDGQPWPKFTFGPIELSISFYFKLIDPVTKVELANQDLKSNLLIWLGRSCVCSPHLYFPFDKADSDFDNYLERISNFLPFKLDPKYLRLAQPNKTRTRYIWQKIKSGQ